MAPPTDMCVNRECDLDTDGLLDQREIQQACKDTGYSDNYDEIRANLKQVTTSATGKIDVEEFIDVSNIYHLILALSI